MLPRGYNSHHILVSAVLNYVDSADYLISCKAMNCLQARPLQLHNVWFDAVALIEEN